MLEGTIEDIHSREQGSLRPKKEQSARDTNMRFLVQTTSTGEYTRTASDPGSYNLCLFLESEKKKNTTELKSEKSHIYNGPIPIK